MVKQKWEYLNERVPNSELQKYLDKAGLQGWELVNFTSPAPGYVEVVFKRAL